MASFLEKLKKGMGVEISEDEEEKVQEKELDNLEFSGITPKKALKESKLPTGQAKPTSKKRRVKKTEVVPIEAEVKKIEKIEEPEIEPLEKNFQTVKTEEEKEPEPPVQGFTLQNLGGQEGQLAIDVYQTDGELIIQSAIAGVKPENLDISIEGDLVLIRGSRERPTEKTDLNYFYQECYWGPFSRQIILPEETDPSRAQATMQEGILTIRIPKIERKKKRKIEVKS